MLERCEDAHTARRRIDRAGKGDDYEQRVVVHEREGQLHKRYEMKLTDKPTEQDDKEAYTAAMAAIQCENDGRLDQAETEWLKVKSRFPEEAKLPFTTKDDELRKELVIAADALSQHKSLAAMKADSASKSSSRMSIQGCAKLFPFFVNTTSPAK